MTAKSSVYRTALKLLLLASFLLLPSLAFPQAAQLGCRCRREGDV